MKIEHTKNIEMSSLTKARGDHPLCLRTAGVLRGSSRIASKPERSLMLKISPMIDEKWCNV